MIDKRRLDMLLVDRALAESRAKAAAMIMAAEVNVDGRLVDKPGALVASSACIRLKEKQRYVSRAGLKLEAALREFRIDVAGKICADVGASTGGFTDCLLQAGAARVHAIDVGSGILDFGLRRDKRVRLLERTNARYLDSLGELVGLIAVDVSFISLRHILPPAKAWMLPQADLVALVKPQFEAGKSDVGKGGIIKDPAVHKRVLQEIAAYAASHGFSILDLMRSPITGKKGNVEFLMWLRNGGSSCSDSQVLAIIRRLLDSTS
ncbi:MAG: TlyA family RNA methyltransferase [Chloroflexota bacterium]|nr:TlyA family RNA methyltransferase [Chloroflexota bacterium]